MMYHWGGASIGIAAGTIDEESLKGAVMQVTEHIFLGQKPAWHAIAEDGVKRWDRFSDELEQKLQEWEKAQK